MSKPVLGGPLNQLWIKKNVIHVIYAGDTVPNLAY
jgi:hypothetical protein